MCQFIYLFIYNKLENSFRGRPEFLPQAAHLYGAIRTGLNPVSALFQRRLSRSFEALKNSSPSVLGQTLLGKRPQAFLEVRVAGISGESAQLCLQARGLIPLAVFHRQLLDKANTERAFLADQ